MQEIRRRLEVRAPELDLSAVVPLGRRIMAQYKTQVRDPSSLRTIMATNQAYSMAKTPVKVVDGGVVPNPEHRVVQDDIPHGLCVLKDIAGVLECATPWMDRLIVWHQELMGKEYLVGGRLVGKDVDECTALTTLGGTSLTHIGFVGDVYIPCKL